MKTCLCQVRSTLVWLIFVCDCASVAWCLALVFDSMQQKALREDEGLSCGLVSKVCVCGHDLRGSLWVCVNNLGSDGGPWGWPRWACVRRGAIRCLCLVYRLLLVLQSRHRIWSPLGKKPAPTRETEHSVQVKQGWCHWRSSNEMYFPPPKPWQDRKVLF